MIVGVVLFALHVQRCGDSLAALHSLDGKTHDDSVAAFTQARAASDLCQEITAATLAGLLSSTADSTWRERLAVEQTLDSAWRRWPNEPHLLLATAMLRYNQGGRTDAGRAAGRALDSKALTRHEQAVTYRLLGAIAQDEWRDWRSFGDLGNGAEGEWHCSKEDPDNAFASSGDMTGMSIATFNIACPATFEGIMDHHFHLNAALNQDNRRRMEDDYRRALALDPAYWPAAQALASEFLFEQNWEAAGRLAQAGRAFDPADYRPLAILALVAYRTGALDTAAARFDAARALMPPTVRTVYDDIGRVITPAESLAYFGSQGAVQHELRDEYWRAHQGVFLNPTNDRLIEHYARVTEAGFLFVEPTTGRMGWDSDAGRVWIRYGRPLKIRDLAMENGRASFWSYGPDPDFVFQRNLRYYAYRTHEDAAGMVQEMAEHRPARFKPPSVDTIAALPRQVVRFWSPADSSHDLVIMAPWMGGAGTRPADLTVGVTLLDSTFRRAASWVGKARRDDGLVASLAVKPDGPFRLVVEELDSTHRSLAQSRDTLTLERPAGLAVSDLMLARKIDGLAAAPWRQLDITPSFGTLLPSGSAMALYWEVYNPPVDSGRVTRYAVNIEVRSGSRPLLARILSGITRQTPKPEASVRFDYAATVYGGKVPNWVNLQTLLQPGRYQVTVTVTDARSGASAVAHRDFEVR